MTTDSLWDEPEPAETVGPQFYAQYWSRCACGESVEPGDFARMVDGRALHDECAEQERDFNPYGN